MQTSPAKCKPFVSAWPRTTYFLYMVLRLLLRNFRVTIESTVSQHEELC